MSISLLAARIYRKAGYGEGVTTRGMTQAAFFVLTTLVDEPRHGYGIVQVADELSEGHVQLRIGTLYGVLDRLTADGLIEPDREEVQQGRLRKYYRLTDAGGAALSAEAERMAAGARTATQRMAAHRPTPAGPAPRAARCVDRASPEAPHDDCDRTALPHRLAPAAFLLPR